MPNAIERTRRSLSATYQRMLTQTKVRQYFREYGHINNIDVRKKEGMRPRWRSSEFRSPEEAASALLRDGRYFGDQVIRVTAATDCTLFVTNYRRRPMKNSFVVYSRITEKSTASAFPASSSTQSVAFAT